MLLSQLLRAAAITGNPDAVHTGMYGRQGGAWAQQWVHHAYPHGAAPQPPPARGPAATPAAPADRERSLRALDELRRRGAVSDEELAALRARLLG